MPNLKYLNKYRIPSARWPAWDYRWPALYFITICTQHMRHYFGYIQSKKMHLSPIGAIAHVLWHEIPHHNPNTRLHEFIVMPNHIHGIIEILEEDSNSVQTEHALSLPNTPQPAQSRYQNIGHGSISTIIGGYKSAVTKHCNRLDYAFQWQRLYYDIVIRDRRAYENISNYIIRNPEKWNNDKFYRK
ncbi:hypothetical protein PEDI_05880 [Persicobacter diffluens]|uniref:Transposase IS200-like domain-containing protein n=1 Tax=Persicobacter diffluens TaxID=981 RepID=A0AAN4VU53_9BACT|nr:hypothetical protein PEDI_05880 [Persicobacter diffluens]